MKRKSIILILLVAAMLLLGGCAGAKMMFTQFGDDITIDVDCKDGKSGETSYFYVGKDCKVQIASTLSEGKIQLEFISAIVVGSGDDETVINGDVLQTVTVTGEETQTISLPEDNYIMNVTAVGNAKGQVKVTIVK